MDWKAHLIRAINAGFKAKKSASQTDTRWMDETA